MIFQIKKQFIQAISLLSLLVFSLACGEDKPTVVACVEIAQDTVTVGNSVEFANCSKFASMYFWDLGDENISHEFAPSHSYTQAGAYTVSLFAGNAQGIVDSVKVRIVVRAAPIE